jgi:hypothetical protein
MDKMRLQSFAVAWKGAEARVQRLEIELAVGEASGDAGGCAAEFEMARELHETC